jgi:hypothetical protein
MRDLSISKAVVVRKIFKSDIVYLYTYMADPLNPSGNLVIKVEAPCDKGAEFVRNNFNITPIIKDDE